jgi:hypothetical protein
LEFVDGKFLGIAQGSRLPDVVLILGITPVRVSELDPADVPFACTGTDDPSVIRTGGLALVFEDVAADTSVLTNWTYSGGPIAGYEELVAPNGVKVGDTRQDLTTAYTDFQDFGDVIDVYQPVHLRFAFEGDTIKWFGIIDCLEDHSSGT